MGHVLHKRPHGQVADSLFLRVIRPIRHLLDAWNGLAGALRFDVQERQLPESLVSVVPVGRNFVEKKHLERNPRHVPQAGCPTPQLLFFQLGSGGIVLGGRAFDHHKATFITSMARLFYFCQWKDREALGNYWKSFCGDGDSTGYALVILLTRNFTLDCIPWSA